MNSFVTKLIVLAIIVGGLVAFVKITSSAKKAVDEAQNPEKTFSEQIADDDAKHRALPGDLVTKDQEKTPEEPAKEQPAEPEAEKSVEQMPEEVQVVREFKEMDDIDRTEAERLFETALADRKIGRLPVTGYKMTVDNCRMLIQRFPCTEFDYKARRLLADIPERLRERYKITPEEVDYNSVGVVSEK